MDQLTQILTEIFKIPASDLTPSFDLRESDYWDSLKFMEMIAAVEEGFGVELTGDEIVGMTDCESILQILTSKGISRE